MLLLLVEAQWAAFCVFHFQTQWIGAQGNPQSTTVSQRLEEDRVPQETLRTLTLQHTSQNGQEVGDSWLFPAVPFQAPDSAVPFPMRHESAWKIQLISLTPWLNESTFLDSWPPPGGSSHFSIKADRKDDWAAMRYTVMDIQTQTLLQAGSLWPLLSLRVWIWTQLVLLKLLQTETGKNLLFRDDEWMRRDKYIPVL